MQACDCPPGPLARGQPSGSGRATRLRAQGIAGFACLWRLAAATAAGQASKAAERPVRKRAASNEKTRCSSVAQASATGAWAAAVAGLQVAMVQVQVARQRAAFFSASAVWCKEGKPGRAKQSSCHHPLQRQLLKAKCCKHNRVNKHAKLPRAWVKCKAHGSSLVYLQGGPSGAQATARCAARARKERAKAHTAPATLRQSCRGAPP